ncbi:MAG: HAMP domain-containing sensor histidine kinase [Bacillota bacterium]|nr:HAMP domain-containing sensor histidine kinase [Bacillota bacterium]
MNTNKRTKSISRKINAGNVWGMFSSFLVIDLLIIIVAVLFWCSSIEGSYTQKGHDISNRSFETAAEASDTLSTPHSQYISAYKEYKASQSMNQKRMLPSAFREYVGSSFYVFHIDDDTPQYTYCGSFLVDLFSNIFIASIAELIILICMAVSGARKIRRQLMPLDDLAFKADMLGSAASFDPQAIEELEHAINQISPTGEGTHLHTGNAEMEHLEDSINGLLDRMRESYQQQSRFVSDASHELRTPISVLQGYVNMLDRWGKDDVSILDESIEAIKSETEHMKKLVEQLLFLARGDSGRTKLTMESFSLNDMMLEVYEESLMIDSRHKYEFRPSTEDIRITGDISMLKQTARILIDNAAKYTPENDSIILKTTISGPAFIIQDEGIGIGSDDAAHMFERFYRSDPARSKDSGGTGLGLSIAKWIIDRHRGYFDVLSREDIGTRITVYLPQKQFTSQS